MSKGFPDRWLEDLKAKNDITDIASQYTVLKQNGHRHVGLCPMHGEKTASFHVDTDKQMFYCFGCGKGGDVIRLVMECEHLVFVEAVEFLAKRANLPLPSSGVDTETMYRDREKRDRLRLLNKEAAVFYNECLLKPEAAAARAYLSERKIDQSLITRFGIGYAPDDWSKLKEHLSAKGFTEEEMASVSLVVVKGNSSFDMFRNRIIFPIIDTYRYVIGFGGRIIGKGEPKYLNSTSNPIFDKGANLYAINLVKQKSKPEYVLLCEGYIDVVALHGAGFDTAVASLGTAFTANQAKLIKRFTPNVYISYDGDAAGQRAALKALDILSAGGLRAKVIVYPDGMDPDDFVKKKGASAMREAIKNALGESAFRESLVAAKFDLGDTAVYGDYAAEAVAALKSVRDPIQLESGLRIIASKTGFTLDTLYEQLGGARARVSTVQPAVRTATPFKSKKTDKKEDIAQANAIALMIEDKKARVKMVREDWRALFTGESFARLYEILAAKPADEEIDIAVVSMNADDETAQAISQIVLSQSELGDREKLYRDCKNILTAVGLEKNIAQIKAQLAQGGLDRETLRQKAAELQKLNVKLQSLKN